VRAAYRGQEAQGGASRIAVYSKRTGGETPTSAELVRESASELTPLLKQLEGRRVP
jgi:hypothetical protein